MIRKKVFIKVIIYNQFAVAMKHDEMLYKSHVSLCTMHFFLFASLSKYAF